MYTTHALRAATAAAALALAGCAGSDANDADVAFAQDMIPHHQQAVEMSQLADGRADSDAVRDLSTDIEAAQGPEIETMTGWLEEWDAEVPDSSMQDMDMAGMMSTEDMSALENASGPEFDQMWLTMMIEHHEGAIEMAQTQQSDGENDEAVELAETIEETQAAEIEQMEQLLD